MKHIKSLQMKQPANYILMPLIGLLLLLLFSSFNERVQTTEYSLTVIVNNLRNAEGVVVFALYNREDAFPDEHY